MEKSLQRKDPKIKEAYRKIIEDYSVKGYVRKTTQKDENQWFLPHFPVVREDKSTTKVRVVFDAAAKYEGKCLNDAILPGPKLQLEIVDVLLRFRRAPVAISADIAEMFLQVCLREVDRPFHRFLWRDLEASREPDVYEFLRLPFGNSSSPFCAQYVLQSHSQSIAAEYPEAAETIESSMYVDDVLDSRETVKETRELQKQLSSVSKNGGFNLRKWSSNQPSVLDDVPAAERLSNIEIQDPNNLSHKTLGVLWKTSDDVFTFHVEDLKSDKRATKRDVLRVIASLFDPLQFLAPFTTRAKMLMQEIWQAGVEWDEILPIHLHAKWTQWASELVKLSYVQIPQCLRRANPKAIYLHIFSDSSEKAYATVAYLVCHYDADDAVTSCIIMSKSRVSPIKAVAIPRLELMGAVLSTRLAKNILKVLPNVVGTTFWRDSTNVLHWIRSESRTFKQFVANRVGEIHRETDPDQWRHVPGELNPADLPTRGMSATELAESKLWIEGPEFLRTDESTWPEKLPSGTATPDHAKERRVEAHASSSKDRPADESFLNPTNFSSLGRLVRVTAWIQRFLANCRLDKENRALGDTLDPDELMKAENWWLRKTQMESFPMGEKQQTLVQLNPKKDEDGLLRAYGRLQNASELPRDAKYPILLPKDHAITKLVIVDRHEKLGHGTGTEHLLAELRARFWVIKGRRAVRNVVESCPECRRLFSAKPAGQMMAPLPESRVTSPLRAFERVGIDYAGPFLTKQGRRKAKAKRYLCLFTCLSTRAVHLEMAYSLDTSSFINAFIRMTSRRGTPAYVISDNGTNFTGAEKEMRELVQEFDQKRIINETTKHRKIKWDFNPPSAPHFGGVFESMIKSSKKAMRAILKDADITDEELETAIVGAEGELNSRPITYVSSDVDDLTPLTPNHFLVGQLGGQYAPEAFDVEESRDLRSRWRRVQQLLGQIWSRWRKEFLPSLNKRGKWFHPQRNLKEGDVVLVVDTKAKRGEWPLGRIIEVYPGKDGLVRVVKVKVGEHVYTRPVHRLCPLECEN